jgi:aerobic carbon-monoxide dehydrogenase medium subunit
MKPVAFDYAAPTTLQAALALLASPDLDCVPLAGGQSLMPWLNLRRVRPGLIVDLNWVAGLDAVRVEDAVVRVGAMTRLRALETNPAIHDALPVLAETAAQVAHPHIRSRATVGGSLCHANPAAELPALAVALGASLVLRGAHTERVVPAAGFFTGPQATTRLRHELLTEIVLPRHQGMRFHFAEMAQRGTSGYPLVGLCLGVATDATVITAARVSAAGIAPFPVRLLATERALLGRRLDDDLTDIADTAAGEADPPENVHGGAEYRRALLGTLIRRTAARLWSERSPG